MGYLLLFFIELFLLFLLSKQMTKHLSFLLLRITKRKTASMYVFSFLFLPGTLVHELAHYFTAIILFVRVGNMHLFPRVDQHSIRLGSVDVAKSDPVRKFFIGVSPILVGTALILFSLFSFVNVHIFSLPIQIALEGYILFAVGNTMFSSKKDVEGAVELLLIVALLCFFFYVLGLRININSALLQYVTGFFKTADLLLVIPLLIDLVFIFLIKLL